MRPPTYEQIEEDTRRREATRNILLEVRAERARQDEKFPNQTLPDGYTDGHDASDAGWAKRLTNVAAELGRLTWRHVLTEEFHEVFEDDSWSARRAELIQLAAVAVRWIEDGDRRNG